MALWLFLIVTIFILGDAILLYWLWKTGRIGRRRDRNWPDKEE